MGIHGARLMLAAAIVASATAVNAGQLESPAAAALSPEAMEAFLLKARIVSTRNTDVGVTDSRRATLSDGVVTHDGHIQTVNVERAVFQAGKSTELNFKDSYRFNIAGYRLARLLGLDNVPMSVERKISGKSAAVTWWVDDVRMDEKGRSKSGATAPDPERVAKQFHVMRVFDELIQNRDRNQGNILWTSDWTMWLIDHTRAFRLGRELLKPDELTRCDASLLAAMRGLTEERIRAAVGKSLTKDEVRAMLARRDLIVARFDRLIAERGGGAVLYSRGPAVLVEW